MTSGIKGRVAIRQINEIEQEIQALKEKPETLQGASADPDKKEIPTSESTPSDASTGGQERLNNLKKSYRN